MLFTVELKVASHVYQFNNNIKEDIFIINFYKITYLRSFEILICGQVVDQCEF